MSQAGGRNRHGTGRVIYTIMVVVVTLASALVIIVGADAILNKQALGGFLGAVGEAQASQAQASDSQYARPLTTPKDAMDGVLAMLQLLLGVVSALVIAIGVMMIFFVGKSQRDQMETLDNERKEMQAARKEERDQLFKTQELISSTQEKVIQAQVRNAILTETNIDDFRDRAELVTSLGTEMEKIINSNQDRLSQFYSIDKELAERRADDFLIREAMNYELMQHHTTADSYSRVNHDNLSIEQGSDSEEDIVSKNRIKIQSLLYTERSAKRRSITGITAFNAAQEAARLNLEKLAHKFAAYAVILDPTSVHQVRLLRSEHLRGDRFEPVTDKDAQTGETLIELKSANPENSPEIARRLRDEAFQKAMDGLRDVPLFNCHLVYAETWNIAINAERLPDLIAALDRSILIASQEGRYISSYAHVIAAQAISAVGDQDWMDGATHHLATAMSKLQTESRRATWFFHSLNESQKLANQLGIEVAGEADDNSGQDATS